MTKIEISNTLNETSDLKILGKAVENGKVASTVGSTRLKRLRMK